MAWLVPGRRQQQRHIDINDPRFPRPNVFRFFRLIAWCLRPVLYFYLGTVLTLMAIQAASGGIVSPFELANILYEMLLEGVLVAFPGNPAAWGLSVGIVIAVWINLFVLSFLAEDDSLDEKAWISQDGVFDDFRDVL